MHWNLPLVHPLPFTSTALLHLELMPLVYLVVGVSGGVSGGLKDQYYLLSVSPSPFTPPHVHSTTEVPLPPRLFLNTVSLIELDLEEITLQHLKMVRGEQSVVFCTVEMTQTLFSPSPGHSG